MAEVDVNHIEYAYETDVDRIEYNEAKNASFMTEIVNVNNDEFINEAEDTNLSISSNEIASSDLFTNKVFPTWDSCDLFISEWAKKKGFRTKKDRVYHEGEVIRKRTYLCDHTRFYCSKSKKDTTSKKIKCQFLVNASCPKFNNPESQIRINKIVNSHNHLLSIEQINFEENKKFSSEMLKDIKFLTSHCKFGATVQRKFLEGKYSAQPIHSKDLYAAIQKFRPTSKSLSNDAALMSSWLDNQKEIDSQWVVVRGWDKDNTLTKLLWMTPEQVKNWIQFSDCVLNDVTHKTNCYSMPLSMFVGFNQYWHNIILAQALLLDESTESHAWMFEEILKVTKKQLAVIMTDADPAVDLAVRNVFSQSYPIHCAFHLTQNINKHLRNSLGSDYSKFLEAFFLCQNSLAKETFEKRFEDIRQNFPSTNSYMEVLYHNKTYWAHWFIRFKFTGESVNSYLKRLLHSSNISLCELMDEVHQLLDMQDQKEEYNFWKLAMPCIRSQNKTNFLFKKIDGCLERILTPIMLQKHRDEINQSVYYEANEFMTDDIERHCHNEQENETYDTSLVEMQQILLNELIYLVGGMDNITNIWSVKVGIVYRHYFKVILITDNAKFHIWLIPSCWYNNNVDVSKESFMNADKFYEEKSIEETGSPTAYLCAFNQDNWDFLEENLSLLQQKKVYGELHSIYKKALNKVLKSQTKSQQLIDLLQEFTEKIELSENSSEDSSEVLSEDSSEDEVDSDKENQEFILLNPKKRHKKGRPAGTKRLKSACEPKKGTKKQERHCKKCSKVGHYQKSSSLKPSF
ncbi:39133_t:CDS:2 [Gigaspora margarita]|uniref:39133_t:CDS:1 n=1 Tax=Gigaspora margarita TaxID=4874 RepID=A0ABN7VQ01_GIGMA|nr:39133_t:CDS:2 [Gigaspora margarita]